jgi:RNA polymerase sigma-70 factor (ECF subfamily)
MTPEPRAPGWPASLSASESGRAVDDNSTDAEVLAAVAAGSSDALAVLYHRHAPWLTLRLSRRCADHTIVDEVLQDTFVAAWKGARRFSGDGPVAAWLWGIAVRRLIDAFRKRPTAVHQLDERIGARHVVESAEDRVLLGVEHGDLAGALDRLSPELRAVMQATALDGLTNREAGQLLGLPTGTVKTRMIRARRALREELA